MIHTGTKVVAAAGTAEALSATSKTVGWITFQGRVGNSDKVYVGDSTVSATNGLCCDEVLLNQIHFPQMEAGYYIDLSLIYVDAAVNGEAVNFVYGEL